MTTHHWEGLLVWQAAGGKPHRIRLSIPFDLVPELVLERLVPLGIEAIPNADDFCTRILSNPREERVTGGFLGSPDVVVAGKSACGVLEPEEYPSLSCASPRSACVSAQTATGPLLRRDHIDDENRFLEAAAAGGTGRDSVDSAQVDEIANDPNGVVDQAQVDAIDEQQHARDGREGESVVTLGCQGVAKILPRHLAEDWSDPLFAKFALAALNGVLGDDEDVNLDDIGGTPQGGVTRCDLTHRWHSRESVGGNFAASG